ncbi:hypothetical protein ACFQY0_20910 [Haloferula chungangensis]|uniref:Tetratricopeptide repeat protein n=1 Tax=Haloferula chungangensis TaxID=1048331 RepID=A0ABW2LEC0_9BACT
MERFLAGMGSSQSGENVADDLYFDAMESPTIEEQRRLLDEALQVDPGHVDANLSRLDHLDLSFEEELKMLEKIEAIAAKQLGKEFETGRGHFWGIIETRPYMRTRARKADVLWNLGRVGEAVEEWKGMIELNPNDNQGVRSQLLCSLLELGRIDEAAALLKRYDEAAYSTAAAYGVVLERFLSGDEDSATEALGSARGQNGFTEAYLKGHRRIPRRMPHSYSMGSREEAVCFAEFLQRAWQAHPEALRWLTTMKK